MSTQPSGRLRSWLGLTAASIAAVMLLSSPASAAEGQPTFTIADRMNIAADPLTEAFGARVVMPLDVKNATRWADVLRRQEQAMAAPAACDDPSADHCFATFWTETVAELKTLPLDERVRRVNDLVNEMGYWSDWDVYRKADYWATPAEMFEKMGGDCEDFALFKYFLLRASGVSAEDLRMTLVASDDRAHMVSLVLVDGAPLVLDCIALQTAAPSELRQYQAVYSLSETGAWFLAAADQPAGVATAMADLGR
ncbi:transglutaminase-like cysteine peptidase [Emcibacter sp. SYSU 3D8]|uniref:transglutaminase-like cysteine peptidase n=1 Tax=Emcibacter sp. SYSU 3D8 TaxID=3133969 RepID=UPI0031FE8866